MKIIAVYLLSYVLAGAADTSGAGFAAMAVESPVALFSSQMAAGTSWDIAKTGANKKGSARVSAPLASGLYPGLNIMM